MKTKVDKDLCIGCELCPSICPEVYSMEEDGKAVAISEEIDSELEDDVLDAQTSCPVEAISVSE